MTKFAVSLYNVRVATVCMKLQGAAASYSLKQGS